MFIEPSILIFIWCAETNAIAFLSAQIHLGSSYAINIEPLRGHRVN